MRYFEVNYILTHYIFPLSEDIILSRKLGISLSNPKTKEEVNQIKELIEVSMSGKKLHENAAHKLRIPLSSENEDIITVKGGLSHFKKNHENNSYVSDFLNKNSSISEWEILAKMWVILRFNQEEATLYKNAKQHELSKLFYPDDEEPFKSNTCNYVNLLSLLLTKGIEDSYGQAIILPKLEFYIIHPEPNININKVILYFCSDNYMEKDYDNYIEGDSLSYYDFPLMKNRIVENANLLEEAFNLKNAQKLLYIGNILKISRDEITSDSRIRFVNYVSILELLLTHNPNFNRFNIEDSISKQFKLKTAILVYLNDNSRNLNDIKNDLKEIYNQRSNITHGNFEKFSKYLEKNKGNETFLASSFYELECKLYEYVQIVMQSYLEDIDFVDFLKDN